MEECLQECLFSSLLISFSLLTLTTARGLFPKTRGVFVCLFVWLFVCFLKYQRGECRRYVDHIEAVCPQAFVYFEVPFFHPPPQSTDTILFYRFLASNITTQLDLTSHALDYADFRG